MGQGPTTTKAIAPTRLAASRPSASHAGQLWSSRHMLAVAWAWVLATGMVSCAHGNLPGTQIRKTEANQQIYGVLEELRHAYEASDSERLLALTSRQYFEDNGSPNAEDDYGYVDMRKSLLREAMAASHHSQLSMELYEIEVRGERAHADVRYSIRAQLDLAGGTRWQTHRDFNRIELVREDGRWKVLSGL